LSLPSKDGEALPESSINHEAAMKYTSGSIIVVIFLFCVAGGGASSPSIAQDSGTARKAINLPRGEMAKLPFSDAVLAGNTLYISGRGGVDSKTMKVPDDVREEAKLMLEQFRSILAEAGMTMDNLVTVTVYCPDLSLYGAFNEVYRSCFSKDFPARAFIGSGPLLFGMHFEMQGIAVK
jgi:2-iminobutanoate/2-iminopropanoate deaminase